MRNGKKLGSPFRGYRGYKVWHKKEGRFYVCLVPRNGFELRRTTITLAKYRLSRKIGRWLSCKEQVDHIDEDKTNDKVSNLQILTGKKNSRKHVKQTGKTEKRIKLKCPQCRIKFKRRKHLVQFKLDQGKKPCCSRKCGGQYSHR